MAKHRMEGLHMFLTQQKVALAPIPKAQPSQMAAQVGVFLGLKTSLSVSGKTISLTPTECLFRVNPQH